jgi:TatD DNase family protein
MKIDIHRHAADRGSADRALRNLFHSQTDEIVPGSIYSIGLHPWHVSADTLDIDIARIREFAFHEQVVAIGEAGLDKAIRTPMDIQRIAFEQQMKIAGESDKPMIIHCVRAYNEILEYKIKWRHKDPWIIHWFNANEEVGEKLIAKGFYLSFGHMLFSDSSKAYHAFLHIPVESIFFETDDARYCIDEIYERAALLRGISEVELEKQIETNFNKCFKLLP